MLKKKRAEKCTKKRGARAKLLFCKSNLLSFWRSRYRLHRWILKSLVSQSLNVNCRHYRELKQRRRPRQRERQQRNRFRLAKQQLCTCITLFCTFLCRRCTTRTWKCVISRFVEDGNTRQQQSFSFPELWYSPLEFNSTKNCQYLAN